jgi:hypothetical protein
MFMYIIFIIILIALIIIYYIIFTFNNKIENFIDYSLDNIQFELTIDNADINKFELVSYSNNIITVTKKIVIYGLPVYMYECVDMPSGSDSIYAVFSSFVINKNSGNAAGNSILATTKTVSPSSIALRDYGFINKYGFNYIFFNFPDEIKTSIFTKVEILFANNGGYNVNNFNILSFNNSIVGNKISLETLINIPFIIEKEGVNQKISLSVNSIFTMENANLILIIYRLYELDISSIKFYFKNRIIKKDEKIEEPIISPKQTLKIFSENQNEQINMMNINSFYTDEEEETEKLYSSSGYNQTLNLLTKLRVPWAVYDANNISQDNSILIEQLTGGCKNATIKGSVSLENDTINYIKGDINSCIEFPENSMPSTFTICAITKYDNPNANKLSILKTLNDPKIIIGHSDNNRGVVKKFNYGYYTNNTSDASYEFKAKSSTDWVVTCIKSSGKDIRKTIIINNEKRGSIPLGSLTTNNRLIINSNIIDKRDCSDFGFSYMIIWNQVLSDNELVMVSNILNNYVIDSSKRINIDRTTITIKDGSTMKRAANSALDIMENFCIYKNGKYWIKPNGSEVPEYIYCILDKECKGGGWMLALKGSKNDTKTFKYSSSHWTTDTVHYPPDTLSYDDESIGELMENELDAKYNIYNSFKAKECLAMFNPKDYGKELNPAYYYNFYSLRKYGWLWHENNFNNGTAITLLDFFKSGKSQFYYSTPTLSNETSLINFMNSKYNSDLVTYLGFDYVYQNDKPKYKYKVLFDYNNQEYTPIISDYTRKGPCNINIWSTQNQFYSYGFNVGPLVDYEPSRGNWPHRVRWGFSFNENGDSKPTTNDVSGGIGMECRDYNAGDAIGCCHATAGENKHFSFKWFIR